MEDKIANASAAVVTAAEALTEIGISAVHNAMGQSSRSVAERTGELVDKIHATLGDHHLSRAVAIYEPDTDVQSIAVLKPGGGIDPMPSEFFDDYRQRPKRYNGTAILTRAQSFIDHVNRFKDSQSALFARDDMAAPRLTAVLDYHECRNDVPPDATAPIRGPRFGQHRALFAFPLSEEWKVWTGKNKQAMNLKDFAEFIEDRFVNVELVADAASLNADIQELLGAYGVDGLASPSKLIELSRGLKVHVKDEVTNAVNLTSGEAEVQFKSEHTDKYGNKLSVPSLFVINIPIFAQGDVYRIAARLRHRVADGALKFWYELWGIERVFEAAFTEVCETARDATELPLFYGTPE